MWKFLAVLATALMLTACDRVPDAAHLQGDITQSLADTFGPDTFEIIQLVRRGTAADSTAPQGETRRIVYYDIRLRLKKDTELGAWGQPGAAALVTLLGAGPRSVRGIKSGGNREDNLITAHASAIYRKTDGVWQFVTPAGSSAETPVLDLEPHRSATQRLGSALEEMSASLPYMDSNRVSKVVDEEVDRFLARIHARLARLQKGYSLASGPEKGEYLAFAQALASLSSNRDFRILPLVTEGGANNIALLRTREAVLGLAQADVALLAWQGKGVFQANGPFPDLRTLGSLYPELVHVIVRNDSGITHIRDLQGKRMSLGAEGSGGKTTLKAVLAAHGVTFDDKNEPVNLPLTTALQQVGTGDLDALVEVIGIPSGALRSALPQANLKLLPLDPQAVETLVRSNPSLMALNIPKGTYPNQTDPIATLGTAALLLTTADLTEEEAALIVRTTFQGGQDILAAGSAQGAQLSAETASRGTSIPLHKGALRELQTLTKQPASP